MPVHVSDPISSSPDSAMSFLVPSRVELPDCAREVLAAVYPTVRWNRVSFHDELPAYVRRFTNVAITLPDPLG